MTKTYGPEWMTALTMIQQAVPPPIAADAEAITVVIEYPPGSAGTPPLRHRSSPAFGYVLEGEMLFELEGQPPRAISAGEAFWEPGGDVIHYQDGNNRDDIRVQFVVTMFCIPGQLMLELVEDEELEARKHLRMGA